MTLYGILCLGGLGLGGVIRNGIGKDASPQEAVSGGWKGVVSFVGGGAQEAGEELHDSNARRVNRGYAVVHSPRAISCIRQRYHRFSSLVP